MFVFVIRHPKNSNDNKWMGLIWNEWWLNSHTSCASSLKCVLSVKNRFATRKCVSFSQAPLKFVYSPLTAYCNMKSGKKCTEFDIVNFVAINKIISNLSQNNLISDFPPLELNKNWLHIYSLSKISVHRVWTIVH